jgi:hypothetical protein
MCQRDLRYAVVGSQRLLQVNCPRLCSTSPSVGDAPSEMMWIRMGGVAVSVLRHSYKFFVTSLPGSGSTNADNGAILSHNDAQNSSGVRFI